MTIGVEDLSRIGFADFIGRVHRLAHVLASLGVTRGDRVGTLAWNHQRHLELYFAVPSSGAILHTINLRLAAEQVGRIVNHAGDVALFVDSDQIYTARQALSAGSQVRHIIVMGPVTDGDLPEGWLRYEELLASSPDSTFDFPSDLSENEVASICYSSATTGAPKGVEYTHRAIYLHTLALTMADTWALSGSDTLFPIVPMFHVNAWGIPFAAIWLGSNIVLPGPSPRVGEIARALVDEQVTFAAAVPTVWDGVLDALEAESMRPDSLRLLVSGGAPLPPPLLDRADRLSIPLIHSYGMTEASPLVLVGQSKSAEAADDLESIRSRRLRQGRLVPGLEMAVLRDGTPVPWDGQTSGELLLRGPWIAERYRGAPELAAFSDGGWYHTGDIVDVDPAGYVRVVDRATDLIKSGGEWISSIQIENLLSEFPGVSAAAVVAMPDPKWGERPIAYLTTTKDITDREIRDYLLAHLPKWWLPATIVRVNDLPLTSVGKIDKRSLRSRPVLDE